MFNPVPVGKRTRYSYARIKEVMEMPHLLDIQRNSYKWFMKEGMREIFRDISPIQDFTENLVLSFEDFFLGKPKYELDECKERDVTYAAPLRVVVRLANKETGEININPNSKKVITAYVEPALAEAKAYESFQFVRNGFFCVDYKDSKEGAPVFNRIVSLKSSFVLPKNN